MRVDLEILFVACLSLALPIFMSGCGGGSSGGSSASVDAPMGSLTVNQRIDKVITPMMTQFNITAATVTVMKNGVVVHDKGYGYQDAAKTIPLPADALFVSASVVKPVTAAAIRKLEAEGKLALSDRAFCTGDNAPCWLPANLLPSPLPDKRVGYIRISDLIEHRGGWVAGGSRCNFSPLNIPQGLGCEPASLESFAQSALGLSGPPTKFDDIRFWMRQPLEVDPASFQIYSNFGYMILGAIIEQASQMSYLSYVNTKIFAPLGIGSADFGQAASLLKDHDPREPNYILTSDFYLPNVFVPGTPGSLINGGQNAANWTSAGTALTTSKAMAMFASSYRIDVSGGGADGPFNGLPLNGKTYDGWHAGSLPYIASVVRQLPSGISYAVFFNNSLSSFEDYNNLINKMDAAVSVAEL